MSKREAIYYVGFIAGAVIAHITIGKLGYGQIFQVIGAVVAGIGAGTLAETFLVPRKPSENSPGQ